MLLSKSISSDSYEVSSLGESLEWLVKKRGFLQIDMESHDASIKDCKRYLADAEKDVKETQQEIKKYERNGWGTRGLRGDLKANERTVKKWKKELGDEIKERNKTLKTLDDVNKKIAHFA